MRFLSVRIAVVAVTLLSGARTWAQNPNNPIQIALLRWYQANTAAQYPACPAVDGAPEGLAFDGSHVWVACGAGNEVQEFNAGDGALVRTITGVSDPYAMAYDGANIWVTNYGGNTVAEINASSGAVSGPFTVGTEPSGLAFDGTNIWVTNFGSNSISKVVATTGVVTNYALGASCPTPYGIAFDGTYLWVACHEANDVAEINPSTGAVLTAVPVEGFPVSVVFDGETGQTGGPFIWTTNYASATVTKISTTTLTPTSFAAGSGPSGIVFDGLYIWVSNLTSRTVTKLSQSTGAIVGTYSTGGIQPSFMCFDGGNVYVSNQSSLTISKM